MIPEFKLEPCPFCGDKKGVYLNRDTFLSTGALADYFVECTECSACGPANPIAVKSVEAWNKPERKA